MSTTERALAVLAALQARAVWSGPELAAHLGVTVRTVRRDVERLRTLGYQVDSDVGVHGGYRLGVGGAAVPPLALDTAEAFALAVCARVATASSAAVGDDAQRALAKLEQLLPARLRTELAEVSASVIRVDGGGDADAVDAATLRTASAACRAGERLVLQYRRRDGEERELRFEPHRVVSIGRRWYLVGRDVDAASSADPWRTLRLDRVVSARATGHRFTIADPPDAVALVQRAISTAPYQYRVRVELDGSAEEVAARVPPTVATWDAVDDRRTVLTTGGDDLDALAFHVALIGLPFRVLEPTELVERLAALGEHVLDASRRSR